MSDITKFLPPKRNLHGSLTTFDTIVDTIDSNSPALIIDTTVLSKTIAVANAAQLLFMFHCQWYISVSGSYNFNEFLNANYIQVDPGNGVFVNVEPIKTIGIGYDDSVFGAFFTMGSIDYINTIDINPGTTTLRAKVHFENNRDATVVVGEIKTRLGCYIVS